MTEEAMPPFASKWGRNHNQKEGSRRNDRQIWRGVEKNGGRCFKDKGLGNYERDGKEGKHPST